MSKFQLAEVKSLLQDKWEKCQETEQRGIEFGQACYEWRKKLEKTNSPFTINDVLKELNVPDEPVNRWLKVYMDKSGIKLLKPEKRMNRSEPPDSFEVLRKLAKTMLTIGFKELKNQGKTDPSHLDAAKTWAALRLEEKDYENKTT